MCFELLEETSLFASSMKCEMFGSDTKDCLKGPTGVVVVCFFVPTMEGIFYVPRKKLFVILSL